MNGINGISCLLGSGWVWPIKSISRTLERGNVVRGFSPLAPSLRDGWGLSASFSWECSPLLTGSQELRLPSSHFRTEVLKAPMVVIIPWGFCTPTNTFVNMYLNFPASTQFESTICSLPRSRLKQFPSLRISHPKNSSHQKSITLNGPKQEFFPACTYLMVHHYIGFIHYPSSTRSHRIYVFMKQQTELISAAG